MGVAVKEEVIKTNCHGCHDGGGVLVHGRDGTVVKIEDDPDFPTNHGSICSKVAKCTLVLISFLDSPRCYRAVAPALSFAAWSIILSALAGGL
jgi:hypothetical protein